MTLRLRLTAWYALVLVATLLVVAVVVWLQFAAALRRGLEEVLEATVMATVELVDASPASLPAGDGLPRDLYLVVFDASGRPVYVSPGAPSIAPPPAGPSTLAHEGGSSDAVFAAPAQGGRIVAAGGSLAAVDRDLDSLGRTMALVGLAAVALSMLGGWWLAGRALSPVVRMAREADAIGSSELDRRLTALEGDDELGMLARTLNRMLARVEESVRRQGAFIAGASHDLRTPLAALRAELELALRDPSDRAALLAAVEAAHADAVRLTELANGLLRLAAEGTDGRRLELEGVPVRRLVREGVELVAGAAAARDVSVTVTAPNAVVRVDRTRLVQAIANLLANAARFAPRGSRVEVVAALEAVDTSPILRVDVLDRGAGVPADFQPSLFEPFAQARPAGSPGSGLGLATAAAAVHAHGGSIGYEERTGGGARFWFQVPT